jgi:hypothetical protein
VSFGFVVTAILQALRKYQRPVKHQYLRKQPDLKCQDLIETLSTG